MESDAGQGHGDPTSPDYNPKAARAKLMTTRHRDAEHGAPASPQDKLAHSDEQDGVLHLPYLLDDELRRLPPADRGQLEDRQPPLRRRRDAQLRHLQSRRSRATTCSSSASHGTHQGQHHRAGRARARRWSCQFDQHQPRPHLRAAAADRRHRAFRARPSRRTIPHTERKHRDQDLQRLPRLGRRTTTTPSWRSCCCSAPTS